MGGDCRYPEEMRGDMDERLMKYDMGLKAAQAERAVCLKKKAYLACAYSPVGVYDPEEAERIRAERFEMANRVAAWLMEHGYVVFSPISHSHPIARYVGAGNLKSYDFWLGQDFPWLDACDVVFVIDDGSVPGWAEPIGVRREVSRAIDSGKTVYMINPVTFKITTLYERRELA